MRYIPFDLLEEIPGREDKFWSLICSDDQFYKLTRAYNTLNQNLCEAELRRECEITFRVDELRKERLWIKDEIFYRLSH
ncbi:MAG: YdcH family protein [Alphaproteobacteria bacterium]|nr:YdcH family protein [Alphaproteobacteria bacterium]